MIFIDAGAIVGRLVEKDQHHDAAFSFWESLASSKQLCYTSNFVLAEAITLIARRTTYHFAAEQAKELHESKILRIVRPDYNDESRAIQLLAKFADQRISFVDCLSFAVMRRLGIRSVFGFDRHFTFAGFQLLPSS